MIENNDIEQLIRNFRKAIEYAKNEGEFRGISPFNNFPKGCCDDVCDLLAEYLLENNVRTYYVVGTSYGTNAFDIQSHAWLELDSGVVIDITGDQFKYNHDFLNFNCTVYFGGLNDFYRLFEVDERKIQLHNGINSLGEGSHRHMYNLYNKVCKYL
jgi:hypothetical protein